MDLWCHPQRYDESLGSLRTYLTLCARHRALDLLRSELRRAGREERHARLRPAPSASRRPASEVAEADTAAAVRAAVRRLPPDQRRVVELAYFGGLSYRDVAARIGHPRGDGEVARAPGPGQAGDPAGPPAAGAVVTPPTPLPAGLRDRVLAAAREARAGGRAPCPTSRRSPRPRRSAGRRTRFLGLLTALPTDAWRTPVLRDLDVQGLVGHLTGVEDDVQRALAGDPDVACADHVASTQPVAERQSGRPPDATRDGSGAPPSSDARRRCAARTSTRSSCCTACGCPLGDLLVVRAFELWTHENDIRRVAGLPRERAGRRRRCGS